MVTITSHIFINIFQMVHFSAVKFTRGNEKNMSFFWYQSLRKFKKNLKQSDRAPLKWHGLEKLTFRFFLESKVVHVFGNMETNDVEFLYPCGVFILHKSS